MEKRSRKTLDRELGLLHVLAISMGAMLGSGIFVLPGLAVLKSGNALALAYLVSALIVLPAALCKCEMATALPRAGGTYLYVDRSVGPLAGTVVGLGTWFSLVFKSAFALVGLGAYFKLLFPALPSHTWLGLAICLALILLNLLGAKKSGGVQKVIVAAALIGLTLFTFAAAPRIDPARLEGMFGVGLNKLLATAGFVFVAFAGVTKISSIAEEVKDPGRNIPLGILISLSLISVIYTLLSLTLVGAAPLESFAGSVTPLATVSGDLWGKAALTAMAWLAILTLTSMANSGLLSSSRFPLAMARDRLLPDILTKVHARFRTPAPAIILTGGLMLSLIAFVPVASLAKLASAFKLLLFCLVNVALIVIRESGARWYKPRFRIPGYPVVPALGVVGSVVLLGYMGPLAWVGAGGIIGGGVLWYFVYARRRVSRRGAVSRLYGERARLSSRLVLQRESSGVIVPIFELDENVDELIPLGAMLAKRDCTLQVLRIEEVPDQFALDDFFNDTATTETIAAHVERVSEETGVEVLFEDVVTHHAKHVLYERAATEGTNWIVMRWQARSPWRFIPDPVAWFIHHPPSNLLLFRDDPAGGLGIKRFQKVLVLAEPGPHDTTVVYVADRFAQATGASLTFAYLTPIDTSDEDLQKLRKYHRAFEVLTKSTIGEAEVIRSGDDMQTVIQLCQDYDLVVIGAPPQSEARGLLRGSFEDQVTERAPCAVLRVMSVETAAHPILGQARADRPTSLSEPGSMYIPDEPGFTLSDRLDSVELMLDGSLRSKDALFQEIGARFEKRLGRQFSPSITELLWERERKQVTAIADGVALPHATCNQLDRNYVELWLLEPAIDFKGDAQPIDVCFVLLGPASERRTHLRLLARIGALSLNPEFLTRVRMSGRPDEVRAIISELESELGGE